MPKNLNDILKGVKKSTTNKLTTGDNPGVDYADKSKDTRDFFDQHPVQKHEDRVGNGDDVYKASNVKKASMLRHGHEPKPKDIRVYDKTNQITNEDLKVKPFGSTTAIEIGVKKPSSSLDDMDKEQLLKVAKSRSLKSNAAKKLYLNNFNRDRMDEAKDPKEYGYEGDMAVTQLKTICRHAEHLMKMLKPDTDLPEWVQAKITKAEDYISTAHDYLMSEMKEETELSEAKCNMSEAGTMCEVHGKKACPSEDDESAENKEPKFTGKKDKEGKAVLITDKKQIQEKLTKKTPVGKIIKDVQKSEDPRFEGDSQEKRKERALAIWYKLHPEKSNKVEEGFLDQRSKKSTASEEARKKMSSELTKKKEKIFDSDLRKQEMVFSHKLKNGKGKIKEQSAPADTSITFPATNSREGLKV